MTLEEAIKHCEEVAETQEENCKYAEHDHYTKLEASACAAEHRQLAEWLRELKELRIENKALKNRCADFEHGAPCQYCPLDCEFRKNKFEEQELKQEVKNSKRHQRSQAEEKEGTQ